MEEDDHGRTCLKFLQEMNVNGRGGVGTATLVEEDSDSFDGGDWGSAKGRGKPERVCGNHAVFIADALRIGLGRKNMRGRDTVGSFGSPLVFFAKAPKNEDAGEYEGECEGEPGAVRNLSES